MMSLPAPYYADEAVTIYHARCEDMLPLLDLSEVAMVLADPPYGLGLQKRFGEIGGWERPNATVKRPKPSTPYPSRIDGDDAGPFHLPESLASMLDSCGVILWGANHYSASLPSSPGWLILDPYTGSGPVLRAAKDMGYRAIGIDSLEWCCERAAERCRQTVLTFNEAAS